VLAKQPFIRSYSTYYTTSINKHTINLSIPQNQSKGAIIKARDLIKLLETQPEDDVIIIMEEDNEILTGYTIHLVTPTLVRSNDVRKAICFKKHAWIFRI